MRSCAKYTDGLSTYRPVQKSQTGSDRLEFSLTGAKATTVTGFSTSAIAVYDITDPERPQRLANPAIVTNGVSASVGFSTGFGQEGRYLAVAEPGIYRPALGEPSYTGTLASPQNGADYLVITHASLKDSVNTLAQHRAKQGYRVKVVTTEQIYDEFSDGLFTPLAVKAFLRYAYQHWQAPAPEFVVLIGDANLDYKDYYKTGQINHVPSYLIETTAIGETPSDHWFVTVAGDDALPDMLIGRIPAKTAEEVGIVTDKIVAYEAGMAGTWRSRVLMATGDQDERFADYSDEWAQYLPSGYTTVRINPLDYQPNFMARSAFSRAINEEGVGIVTYLGHGGVDRWIASDYIVGGAALELISSNDVSSLANYRTFPFFVAFNCLNGFFGAPGEGKVITLPDKSAIRYSVPLPEALLFQKNSGALAMWSPSAFAYPSEQRWIGHELFAAIFDRGERILGRATTEAKVRAYLDHGVDEKNLDVFTFIGDPATRLNIAGASVSSVSGSAKANGGGGALSYLLILFLMMISGGRLVYRAGLLPGYR